MSFWLEVCENIMRLPQALACVGYLFKKLSMASAKILLLGTHSKQPSMCPKGYSLNISWFQPRIGIIVSVILKGWSLKLSEHYFTNVMEHRLTSWSHGGNGLSLSSEKDLPCGGWRDGVSMGLSRGRGLGDWIQSGQPLHSLLCTILLKQLLSLFIFLSHCCFR